MIPVLLPKLPLTERLRPYLAEIDRSRIYSNFGPLARALEARLADHFGLGSGTIATVANATLGLTLALMAEGAPWGSLCVMPGWTFVASAQAAVLAGLTPYFIEVDPVSWALDPDVAAREITRAPGRVGAVMVVAPFGQPIDYQAWDEFKDRTGLPIVIDAAAAFDTLQVGRCPAVVSLHATKVFGVGEGGFVASRDAAIIRSIAQRSNFGFHGNRIAEMPSLNAKLSEYHAAVGLAGLDMWSETRAEWLSVAGYYRGALANSNAIHLQSGFGAEWISSTCIASIDERAHVELAEKLSVAGIDTRMWWGKGAHAQPFATGYPRTSLAVTDRLASSTLGLPFYRDLHKEQVEHVVGVLVKAVS